ncbi:MAG TPA: SBBP repeat-containing protein, partial [Spirochaetota bacterium]|nr:SBBP repeat-containing protein [Spirochaetota bacterium]
RDIFITKIDSAGNYVWTKKIGGTSDDYEDVNSITTDKDNNIFITGFFYGTVNFALDWGSSDTKTKDMSTQGDIFITKINSNGTYGWTKSIGNSGDEDGKRIVTDIDGNVYITGFFQDSINFGLDWSGNDSKTSSGLHDIFVTKIMANGTYGWTKVIGGSGVDVGDAILIDSDANIYIAGRFSDVANFGADWSTSDNKSSCGDCDIFITKIKSDGSYCWSKTAGGTGYDWATSLTIDLLNNVYLSGIFSNTVDFRKDWDGKQDVKTTSSFAAGMFITKIEQ